MSDKFKVGDEAKFCWKGGEYFGQIVQVNLDGVYFAHNADPEIGMLQKSPRGQYKYTTDIGESHFDKLTLINSDSMNQVSLIAKQLLSKDDQLLLKMGYITESLQVTEKASQALKAILFQQNKAALLALAKEEAKEEEKCS